jgi:hypothetical protein
MIICVYSLVSELLIHSEIYIEAVSEIQIV